MKAKIDWGFSCGRHFITINDKVIAQTEGDDIWLKDEDVKRIIEVIFQGKKDNAKAGRIDG